MESGTAPAAYDRTPVLVGAAVAVLIALVAAIDFRAVVNDVPRVPAPCEESASRACQASRNAELQARSDRARELEDDYDTRAWAYGFAALAAIVAGAAVAIRRIDPRRQRELFTDLGVLAVVWLLGVLVLSLITSGEIIDFPNAAFFYPGVALVGVAGIGTLVSRRLERLEASPRPAQRPRSGTAVRVVGLGLTAIAVIASVIVYANSADPCGDPGSDDDGLLVVGFFAAVGAALTGLFSLIQRRWIGSLIMLGVGPFAAITAAVLSVCWN